jgi:hypothetical protein
MLTLVRGSLPSPTHGVFAIVAKRYRYKGHLSFDLTAESPGSWQEFTVEEPVSRSPAYKSRRPELLPPESPFSFSEKPVGCDPALTLVWGLLRVPADTVLIRSGAKSTPLTRVEIPATLHAGGELAYGTASTASTLVIENAATKLNEERKLETPPTQSGC